MFISLFRVIYCLLRLLFTVITVLIVVALLLWYNCYGVCCFVLGVAILWLICS